MTASKPSTLFSTPLQTISGTVRNLHREQLEYVNPEKPTHDHSSVYYKRFFISKFNLEDRAIEAKFSTPMKLTEGDAVTVSGYPKGKVFSVLAYKNATQQVSGHENWIVLALGAIFFFAVTIGLLNSDLVAQGALIPKLFLLGFTIVAMYMGYRAFLIYAAIRLLSS